MRRRESYGDIYYLDGDRLTVLYPDVSISFRLNPRFENKTFIIPFEGQLRECVILSSRIRLLGPKSDIICQFLTLDIAGVGKRQIEYAQLRERQYSTYRIKNYLYSSVENYKNKLYTNPFLKENSKEFFEHEFGEIEWHYCPAKSFLECGSISHAVKYEWDGTKAVSVVIELPIELMSFLPDGTVVYNNCDYVNHIKSLYSSKKECEDAAFEIIEVVKFDTKPQTLKTFQVTCECYVNADSEEQAKERFFKNKEPNNICSLSIQERS